MKIGRTRERHSTPSRSHAARSRRYPAVAWRSAAYPRTMGAVQTNGKRARGRPAQHALTTMRKALTTLTTRRLDGRSAVAVGVRRWKEGVRGDLGGGLSWAQETLLELAAQSWVLVSSLDDWLARQPSLVTRKRQLLPVVVQRQTLVDSLARLLDKLGTKRRAKPVDLGEYIRERDRRSTRAAAS